MEKDKQPTGTLSHIRKTCCVCGRPRDYSAKFNHFCKSHAAAAEQQQHAKLKQSK